MAETTHLLIVDDEESIRFTLKEALQRHNYAVTTAASGEEALNLLRETVFDAAIVDLNLGGRVDGLRVLEAIRWRWPDMAVIILTAHGSLESAIAAIREHVDDYLLKPARPSEVHQALQRALNRRRSQRCPEEPPKQNIIQAGDFFVDLDQHLVTRAGQPLKLTPSELRLLVHLMRNKHRVVQPMELAQVAQGYSPQDPYEARQIVKWYIHRLRQRIEPDPSNPRHIVSVRGVGYRFVE
jgi:DNA-binding response OmpR family regulator